MAFLLTWDGVGEKFYEAGVKNGVLFPMGTNGYEAGVAWNGLTSVSDNPEGADATDIYADDIKYGTIRSAEKAKLSIEAYTYPDEFAECDGSVAVADGVYIGQQKRKTFGFVYTTTVFDDAGGEHEKIHIAYGCTAAPSQKQHQTINDSVDAMTFSWDVDTTPVSVDGYKPTATFEIDSRTADAAKLTSLKQILYGTAATTGTNPTEAVDARLPLPDETISHFGGSNG